MPPGPTMPTTGSRPPATGLSGTETGNYDFGASLSVQKNSTDSLMQASVFQVSNPNSQRQNNNLLAQKHVHGKTASNYNVRMQEPIRLQATNSVMSQFTSAVDYMPLDYG